MADVLLLAVLVRLGVPVTVDAKAAVLLGLLLRVLPVLVAGQALVDAHVHRSEVSSLLVAVLVKDGRVVADSLEDLMVYDTEDTAANWGDPIDLVVLWELASLGGSHDRRAETAGGVQATSSPGDDEEMRGEERETDADRGEVGSTMLLDSCRGKEEISMLPR